VSLYEQYIREYRSVLYLVEQTRSLRGGDPDCDAQERLRLLQEDLVASFVHVTERMQMLVRDGKLEVDVVLAALVRECCDRLALLDRCCVGMDGQHGDPELRRLELVRPADELFKIACRRMLKGSA
jgi:hypothetical protein